MTERIPCISATLIGLLLAPAAMASETCAPLPASLANFSVSYINEAAELQRLDNQLEAHLKPCLASPTPDTIKAICKNGPVAAEQVLRLVSRIDSEGKSNPVLGNAKMKSYKTSNLVIDKVRKFGSEHACP